MRVWLYMFLVITFMGCTTYDDCDLAFERTHPQVEYLVGQRDVQRLYFIPNSEQLYYCSTSALFSAVIKKVRLRKQSSLSNK